MSRKAGTPFKRVVGSSASNHVLIEVPEDFLEALLCLIVAHKIAEEIATLERVDQSVHYGLWG